MAKVNNKRKSSKNTDQFSMFNDAHTLSEEDLDHDTDNKTNELTNTESPEIQPENEATTPQVLDNTISSSVKKSKKHKKSGRFEQLCKQSVILSFIIFVSNEFYQLLRNTFTVTLFTSYKSTASAFASSFTHKLFLGNKISGFFSSLRRKFQYTATFAVIPKAFSSFTGRLLNVKTRVYSMILLSFGAITLFCHIFVTNYFSFFNYDVYAPLTGLLLMLVATILIPQTNTLSEAITESRIINLFLFELLGIKRPQCREHFTFSYSSACLIGTLLGALSLFTPARDIVFIICLVIYSFIVFASPEAGLISILIAFPFASNSLLLFGIAVLCISYFTKVAAGKRTFHLEFMDLAVIVFMVIQLFGEIVSFGSNSSPLTTVLFTAVYLLTVSILRTSLWFERGKKTFITVLSALSLFAPISLLVTRFFETEINTEGATDIYSGGNALNSYAMLSLILLPALFMFLSELINCKSVSGKIWFSFATIADIVFLINVLSNAAWIGAILSVLIFVLLYKGKSIILLFAVTVMIPFLPILGIYSFDSVLSLFSVSESKINTWNAVIRMIFDYPLTGIGSRTDAFQYVYPSYFVGNTDHITSTGSLILQITLSLGIVGLLVFILVFLSILQSSFSFGRSCSDKSSPERITCYAGMCGVISLFFWGIREYIWFNPRAMLVFWILSAITVCTRRSFQINIIDPANIDNTFDTTI